jgi:hypothetical protein
MPGTFTNIDCIFQFSFQWNGNLCKYHCFHVHSNDKCCVYRAERAVQYSHEIHTMDTVIRYVKNEKKSVGRKFKPTNIMKRDKWATIKCGAIMNTLWGGARQQWSNRKSVGRYKGILRNRLDRLHQGI